VYGQTFKKIKRLGIYEIPDVFKNSIFIFTYLCLTLSEPVALTFLAKNTFLTLKGSRRIICVTEREYLLQRVSQDISF
jgi:hypothetical protein